jgi:hypothetical protein
MLGRHSSGRQLLSDVGDGGGDGDGQWVVVTMYWVTQHQRFGGSCCPHTRRHGVIRRRLHSQLNVL